MLKFKFAYVWDLKGQQGWNNKTLQYCWNRNSLIITKILYEWRDIAALSISHPKHDNNNRKKNAKYVWVKFQLNVIKNQKKYKCKKQQISFEK